MCASTAGASLTDSRGLADPIPALVRQAQAGDPDAMEALARWCYPRVRRWALVRTGEPDEADDVTQDVIAGLHRTLRSYAAQASFGTWLYRVTANAAGLVRRRGLRRLALLRRRWPREARADDEQNRRLDQLHSAAVAELVRVFFRELPERQRVVFDLADLQGLGAAEIADMLGLDAATVRGHLMRARRSIRSRILARLPTLAEDRP